MTREAIIAGYRSLIFCLWCAPQTQSPKDFESVELGDLDKREEQQQKEKVPRRIIHFSSGETMEEYSTDEDEAEEKEAERKDLLSSPADAVRVRNSGGEWENVCVWVCGHKELTERGQGYVRV